MTPTFPPSPAQGETAGVSEPKPTKMICDAGFEYDVYHAADYEALRQQLAELQRRIGLPVGVLCDRLDSAEQQLAEMRVRVDNLYRTIDSKQAKIDALMMEFCPGEMSAEQRAEWARNQVAGDPFATSQPDCDDGDICLCVEDLGPAMSCPQHGTVTVEIKHKSVEALRANCSHASRTDGICDLCEDNVASHDPVRSAGETHPAPERGKCERCNGTRKIRTYRKLGDTTPQVLDCPDCAQPSQSTCADPVEACRLFCAWKGGGPCLAENCPRRDCAQPERQGVDWLELKAAVFTLRRHNHQAAAAALEHAIATLNAPASPPPTDDIVAGLRRLHDDMRANGMLMAMPIIKQAIAALEGDKGWQKIETAPKDGRSVLLGHPGFIAEGYWDCGVKKHRICGVHSEPITPFTHWMPMPSRPLGAS